MADITVLLPIYNESNDYVVHALDSILNQTFHNFFIFVSLDNPNNFRLESLMKDYEKKDSRIIFFKNERNLGLAETLNRLIDRVETKYIARMDADDIAFENRFQVQYEYMEKNPDYDLCGTNIIYINKNGNIIYKKGNLPDESKAIQKSLKYMDCFCHPTFFVKTAVMKKVKYRNLKYAQDYDFICRLVEQKYNLMNINEYLLLYRIGESSPQKLLEQKITAGCIQKFYKKKNLSIIDIEKYLNKSLSKMSEKNVERYYLSCENYKLGVIELKNKKFAKAIIPILKSLFQSKYQRKNIYQAIVYRGIIAPIKII